LQADTQMTVTMLCLAGLRVLDKKINTKWKKKRWQKSKKRFLHLWWTQHGEQ